eukprot:CAMPEP_0172514826 /NCGR_PEP_ID=MMETSP1066-20121228/263043_1 /TAXON_ID=671091 /ORGANISM="Coscinodiscus wailesii, Strain CCMP2513" /LENGTH=218 /DNA_ID=CAMNT_0013295649 /DNA_START=6 /DNA_END=659 /DNA_ORIENTATION=+
MTRALIFTIFTISNAITRIQSLQPRTIIKVCQNKHCLKQFTSSSSGPSSDTTPASLFRNLLSPSSQNLVTIETTGCLSHCDKGPNVQVTENQNPVKVYNGVNSPEMAATVLEACHNPAPPVLIAAQTVISQAHSAEGNAKEQDYLLSSAISVLESDEELSQSHALFAALVFRSRVRLNMSSFDLARDDVMKALGIDVVGGVGVGAAWRLLAEVEELRG